MTKRVIDILKEEVKLFKNINWEENKKDWREGTGTFSDEWGSIYTYVGKDIDISFEVVLIGQVEGTPFYECYLAHSRPLLANCYDFITTDQNDMIDVVIYIFTYDNPELFFYDDPVDEEEKNILLSKLDEIESKYNLTEAEKELIENFRMVLTQY